MITDIFESFKGLASAQSRVELSAIALPGVRSDYLARSEEGAPVFLLSDSSSPIYVPAIELRNVRVDFHRTCSVSANGSHFEGQFATISCDAGVPELYEIFIRSVAASLQQLSSSATTSELQECIQSLLRLFRDLSRPSNKNIAGLWGELFVIYSSRRKDLLLAAWHLDVKERFDFSWDVGCLEIKATTMERRSHQFAQEQLNPPEVGSGHVVSVMLRKLNGGLGVVDLAKEIEKEILSFPELRTKLWKSVLQCVGSDFSERLDVRFDLDYAERNVMIVAMSEVPNVHENRDSRISAIRFQADLSSITAPCGVSALAKIGSMFS
ncbi:PD-(D/E)XK motif protein [Isoptericola jiangsuensis]|uniref:PD-(D/E)XK motif protein n=1 Tax=Isoptericola jiangsuensis TaxID=548579 RepID=UPI003864327C